MDVDWGLDASGVFGVETLDSEFSNAGFVGADGLDAEECSDWSGDLARGPGASSVEFTNWLR